MVDPLYSVLAFTCAFVLLIFKNQFRIVLDKSEKTDKDFLYLANWVIVFCLQDGIWGIFGCGAIKDNFLLVGFVPEKQAEKFEKPLSKIPGVSVVIKPPDSDVSLEVPVKLKTNKFTNPFSLFVEMYGLPSYDGFNPTTLVAITYTLLFGIMFGDLGQGLVISIAGALLYKKTKNKGNTILCSCELQPKLTSVWMY